MATNLAIDPDLLEKALEVSGLKTKKETVNLALQEFISQMAASHAPFGLEGALRIVDAAVDHTAIASACVLP